VAVWLQDGLHRGESFPFDFRLVRRASVEELLGLSVGQRPRHEPFGRWSRPRCLPRAAPNHSTGQGRFTSVIRVPQFCLPSAVWLDSGGMYSFASQTWFVPSSSVAQP